jgi:hypothetical protein
LQVPCRERLPRLLPPDQKRPSRVCSQDDSRCGLLPGRRRRRTAQGVPPGGLVHHPVAWFYVYGAVAPTTGARFLREWPSLEADACPLLVDAFAPAVPDRLNRRRLDHSGAHPAQRLQWPEHVRDVRVPPDGPELNPSERVWRALQDALAWLHFPNLAAQQLSVETLLQADDASTLQALPGDAYLVEAIHALSA